MKNSREEWYGIVPPAAQLSAWHPLIRQRLIRTDSDWLREDQEQ
jgi:hypothetical protein